LANEAHSGRIAPRRYELVRLDFQHCFTPASKILQKQTKLSRVSRKVFCSPNLVI